MAAIVMGWSSAALAQVDLCTNIRLSVSEQIECRGRFANSLGEGDRMRIQQEYEDRIRRANDQLITPPVLRSQPPVVTTAVPSITQPAIPAPPGTPQAPSLPGGTASPAGTLPTAPAGELTKPGGPPPGGRAVAPDTGTPPPTGAALPPVAPLPGNPAGSLPRPN